MNPIRIDDRLPEDRQRVLFYSEKRNEWLFGIYYVGQDLFTGSMPGYIGHDCFWWMPEPQGPGDCTRED